MKQQLIEGDGRAFASLRKNFIQETERSEFEKIHWQSIALDKKDKDILIKIGFSI